MKKVYFLGIGIFLIYAFNLYGKYKEIKVLSTNNSSYDDIVVIENGTKFNLSSYIFQHSAWNLEKKIDKEALLRANKNKKSDVILNISVDKTKSPIQICDGVECYEFIAIKNNKLIIYGKGKKSEKTFISLEPNEKLNKRLTLHKLESTSFSLYDDEFEELITLSMFDINLSKYKTKDLNNSKILPGGKNEK